MRQIAQQTETSLPLSFSLSLPFSLRLLNLPISIEIGLVTVYLHWAARLIKNKRGIMCLRLLNRRIDAAATSISATFCGSCSSTEERVLEAAKTRIVCTSKHRQRFELQMPEANMTGKQRERENRKTARQTETDRERRQNKQAARYGCSIHAELQLCLTLTATSTWSLPSTSTFQFAFAFAFVFAFDLNSSAVRAKLRQVDCGWVATSCFGLRCVVAATI